MGSFAELERKRLVKKLKAAREHKKAEGKSLTLDGRGKCGGRLSLREKRPEVLEAALKVNDGRSLDKIAAALAEQGHVTPSGKPYSATAIKTLLGDEFHSKAKEIRSYVKRKKAFYESRESEES
jgi:DNA invertase Pin-like site-specific DNA recombinase